jgi:hypothetical protein
MQTQTNDNHVMHLRNGKYSLCNNKGEVKPLPINGRTRRPQFDWLDIVCEKIIVKYEGKWYGFNADLTPIVLVIGDKPRLAFDDFRIDKNGIIKVIYGLKEYVFNLDGDLVLGSDKKSIYITLPQSIYITVTQEDKILWYFMLADTQRKLKKTLTEREFLSLLMESYQKTTSDDVDDVDEKPEKAFFMNAKTARKMMQRVLDGGDQELEKAVLNAQKYDVSRMPYDGELAPKDFKPNLRPIVRNESKHNQYTNTTPYITPHLQAMVSESVQLDMEIEAIVKFVEDMTEQMSEQSNAIAKFVEDMTERMSEKSNALEANFKREK